VHERGDVTLFVAGHTERELREPERFEHAVADRLRVVDAVGSRQQLGEDPMR
jgi:hypothetical protein